MRCKTRCTLGKRWNALRLFARNNVHEWEVLPLLATQTQMLSPKLFKQLDYLLGASVFVTSLGRFRDVSIKNFVS